MILFALLFLFSLNQLQNDVFSRIWSVKYLIPRNYLRPNRIYVIEPIRNRNFNFNFVTESERNRNLISASTAETEPNIRSLPENWPNIPFNRIFGRLLCRTKPFQGLVNELLFLSQLSVLASCCFHDVRATPGVVLLCWRCAGLLLLPVLCCDAVIPRIWLW